MSGHTRATRALLLLALASTMVIACGPSQTITETITEAEFNEEAFVYYDEVFNADFQPGKILLTGEAEGEEVAAELAVEIVDGEAVFKVLSVTMGGQAASQELFDVVDADLSKPAYTPEEGYVVTDVAITDNELTITSTLQ